MQNVSLDELLNYEIVSSWAQYIPMILPFEFVHSLVARYFAQKVVRKYNNYEQFKRFGKLIKDRK